MKRFLGIICILLVTLNCLAKDDVQVKIVGYYQQPGGNYVELTTPKLPADVVNLKYAYTLTAKDDEHSVIDCIVKFPKSLNIVIMSQAGVQPLKLEDGKATALLTTYEDNNYRYCEFLIPQIEKGTGFVEFQLKDGAKLKGKDIPVEFTFTKYRQSFWKRNVRGLAIGGAVVVGAVVTIATAGAGAPAAAGIVAGAASGGSIATGLAIGAATATVVGIASNQIAKEVVSEEIQEIKEKYSGTDMNDSYHKFTLQFR